MVLHRRTSRGVFQGPPVPLSSMTSSQRAAWRDLLREGRPLCEARRASRPTGCAAIKKVVKNFDHGPYGRIGPPQSAYTPIVGNIIAEPSRPTQTVPKLSSLPDGWAQFYADERRVLQDPQPPRAQIEEFTQNARSPGGSQEE